MCEALVKSELSVRVPIDVDDAEASFCVDGRKTFSSSSSFPSSCCRSCSNLLLRNLLLPLFSKLVALDRDSG